MRAERPFPGYHEDVAVHPAPRALPIPHGNHSVHESIKGKGCAVDAHPDVLPCLRELGRRIDLDRPLRSVGRGFASCGADEPCEE